MSWDDDARLNAALAGLRQETEDPSEGFSARVLAVVGRPAVRWRGDARRLAFDPRVRVAAASVGGLVVGAAAVAILWRRSARRVAAA